MAKLHELIAVEPDLKSKFIKILNETIGTFTKKEHLFKGYVRTLKWFDSDRQAAEPTPAERSALASTVSDRLEYQEKTIVRYLDALLQKEATNQIAKADIVIGETVIAKDVPATFLLGLEKLLVQIRATYNVIPTLPPNIEWVPDPDTGKNIYKSKYPDEAHKTEQTIVPQVLYEATKEHPAQVDKITEKKNVGLYTKHEWCSMLSPAQKSDRLQKIDDLLAAVKTARQRANTAKVLNMKIGQQLMDFIEKFGSN